MTTPDPPQEKDRHKLVSLSRLTDPATDRWVRDYARRTGQGVMRVVTRAVQAYRQQVDPSHEEDQP